MSYEIRQSNQARRIQQGTTSGQLTAREAQVLKAEQQQVQTAIGQARADGKIDKQERAGIKSLQDAASKDIYTLKHNDERQPWAKGSEPTGPKDTTRMDYRQGRQSDRIEHGLAQGQLTQQEAQRLVGMQRQIHQAEKLALADGGLDPTERARIEQLQNQASTAIFLARHNSLVP